MTPVVRSSSANRSGPHAVCVPASRRTRRRHGRAIDVPSRETKPEPGVSADLISTPGATRSRTPSYWVKSASSGLPPRRPVPGERSVAPTETTPGRQAGNAPEGGRRQRSCRLLRQRRRLHRRAPRPPPPRRRLQAPGSSSAPRLRFTATTAWVSTIDSTQSSAEDVGGHDGAAVVGDSHGDEIDPRRHSWKVVVG